MGCSWGGEHARARAQRGMGVTGRAGVVWLGAACGEYTPLVVLWWDRLVVRGVLGWPSVRAVWLVVGCGGCWVACWVVCARWWRQVSKAGGKIGATGAGWWCALGRGGGFGGGCAWCLRFLVVAGLVGGNVFLRWRQVGGG